MRKRCGWFCRNWRKIAGVAAAVLGGPIGIAIGTLLQFVPSNQDKSFSEFSPRVDQLLSVWAKTSFDSWFISKLHVFKEKPSLSQLLSTTTINQINRVLSEMASLVKYYQYKSEKKNVDAELYAAKAIVVQDAIIEFSEIYQEAIKQLKGIVYVSQKTGSTRNISNAPDPINWAGKSFTITMPVFSRTKPSIFILPPVIDIPFGDPNDNNVSLPIFQERPTTPVNCFKPPCGQDISVFKPIRPKPITSRPVRPNTTKPRPEIETSVQMVTQKPQVTGKPKDNASKKESAGIWKVLTTAAIVYAVTKS